MITRIEIRPDQAAKCWLATLFMEGVVFELDGCEGGGLTAPLPFTLAATYAQVRAHLAQRWPGAAILLREARS